MEILKRLGLTLFVTVVCLIPTWIFIGARMLFSPEGFWQNIVVAGLGLYVLGGFQILGLIFIGVALFSIWE